MLLPRLQYVANLHTHHCFHSINIWLSMHIINTVHTRHRSARRALQGRHERRELLGHTASGAAEEVLWGGVIFETIHRHASTTQNNHPLTHTHTHTHTHVHDCASTAIIAQCVCAMADVWSSPPPQVYYAQGSYPLAPEATCSEVTVTILNRGTHDRRNNQLQMLRKRA